jgi:hypothetical protein
MTTFPQLPNGFVAPAPRPAARFGVAGTIVGVTL